MASSGTDRWAGDAAAAFVAQRKVGTAERERAADAFTRVRVESCGDTIERYIKSPSSSQTVGTLLSKPAASKSVAQRPRSVNSVATTARLCTLSGSLSSNGSLTSKVVAWSTSKTRS